jgi:hypothetical protein
MFGTASINTEEPPKKGRRRYEGEMKEVPAYAVDIQYVVQSNEQEHIIKTSSLEKHLLLSSCIVKPSSLLVKRALKILLWSILIIIAVFAFQNYPFTSNAKPLASISDTANIRKNLELVINTPKPRYYRNVDMLDTVANRIQTAMLNYTSSVSVQPFTVNNAEYKNIIASFGPVDAKRIVVGAHYDVCSEQDGADDNASGVAGILELARLLQNKTLKYRIDLVAYSLEEPPFFATENMGSFIHAKSLHDAKADVLGMVSLEMIGYYSDKENSQDYPIGPLKWIYGNKADFITIVQKSFCGSFAKQYKKLAFTNNSIDTKSFRAPSFIAGIDYSDHRNYWHFGYSAIMVTNTSFNRNNNYHQASDKLATLDIGRMALTIDGVYRTLLAIE